MRRLHLALLILLLLPGSRLVAQVENSFGVVEGFWLPDVVCELHPGWERIIFDWAQHQPTGPDDWHTLNVDDNWLKAANACDREVVAVFKHTPAWATDGTPGPGVPRGLYLPVDDPNNLWANFVRRSAHYYASRGVRHFIVGNEPDISSDTYGYEFEGTLEDYYQMLRVGYLAAKEGNSSVVIHLAGTTYWHDINAYRRLYVDRLLERITADPEAAAHNFYFDVLSLHIYFRTDSIYDIVHEHRELLDRYGLTDKTIWINETNASPTEDPLWPVERPVYHLNLEQQAAFLVQAAGLGLAAGAERIAVYKFYDWSLPPGSETFGLLRADSSRRPAFESWRMVIRYLQGVESGSLARTHTVDLVRLRHTNGRQTVLAWARTAADSEVQISASGEKAYLLDQYGNITVVRPVEGVYTLSLPGANCNEVDGCPVGGNVTLLVQPDSDGEVHEITSSGATPLTFQ